ncbi:MAG: hypothetical protein ACJAT7_000432 [Psychromonas sp.]|jgi:hypothetical protein
MNVSLLDINRCQYSGNDWLSALLNVTPSTVVIYLTHLFVARKVNKE